jgi:Diguanylate cyclase, GGDEF domain
VPQPSGRQPAANAAGRESGHERFVRLKKEIHTQLVTGPRMPAVNAVNDYELRQELRRGVEQICQGRGDQALKELGAAFRKDKRQEDIICRYGGEEFAVLLPESDAETAYTGAERLRSAAEREVFPRLPMLSAPITVSVGLAFRTSRTTNASEMIDWADQELYRAKAEGRTEPASCKIQKPTAPSIAQQPSTKYKTAVRLSPRADFG